MNPNKVGIFFNMLEYLATENKLSETFTNILIFCESGIQINQEPDTLYRKMSQKGLKI
jgi:hypothetical protein